MLFTISCIASPATVEHANVAVFIEQHRGKVAAVSYEMLGAGRRLADQLGERLLAVLIGRGMRAEAESLIAYGADSVHYMEGPEFGVFRDDTYFGLRLQDQTGHSHRRGHSRRSLPHAASGGSGPRRAHR